MHFSTKSGSRTFAGWLKINLIAVRWQIELSSEKRTTTSGTQNKKPKKRDKNKRDISEPPSFSPVASPSN